RQRQRHDPAVQLPPGSRTDRRSGAAAARGDLLQRREAGPLAGPQRGGLPQARRSAPPPDRHGLTAPAHDRVDLAVVVGGKAGRTRMKSGTITARSTRSWAGAAAAYVLPSRREQDGGQPQEHRADRQPGPRRNSEQVNAAAEEQRREEHGRRGGG